MVLIKERRKHIENLHHSCFSLLGSTQLEKSVRANNIDELQRITMGYISFHNVSNYDKVVLSQRFCNLMGYTKNTQLKSVFYDDFTLKYIFNNQQYKKCPNGVNIRMAWGLDRCKNTWVALITYGKKIEGKGLVFINFPISNNELQSTRFQELNTERKYFRMLQSLTEREMTVLSAIKCGKKRREIADALLVSVQTYDVHRKNIREKLEVNNFADLIKFFKYIN